MELNIDEVYGHLGGFGRYQKLVYALCLLSFILLAWVTTLPIVIAAKGDVECTAAGVQHAQNTNEFSCSLLNIHDRYCSLPQTYWEFEADDASRTLAVEWNLYCDTDWKVGFTSTMFFFGVWIGTSLFGYLSESLGRRKSFFLFTLSTGFFHFLSLFSTDYISYLVLRTLAGVGTGGCEFAVTLYLFESVRSEHRDYVSVGICAGFSVGMMMLAPLAALIPHWRLLTLTTSLPYIFIVPFYWHVVESPHYLIMQHRQDELELSLRTIARVNKCSSTPVDTALNSFGMQHQIPPTAEVSTPFQLVRRHPVLFSRFMALMVAWIFVGIGYYGLSFNVGNLGGNLYTSLFLSALAELPAFGPTSSLVATFGRKTTAVVFLAIASISFLLSSVISVPLSCEEETSSCVEKNIRLIGSLVGKGAIAAIHALLYIYTVELFPTSIRSRVSSYLSQGSRFGSMAAPLVILQLANVDRSLPFVVLGVFAIVSTGLMARLNDTEEITDKEVCQLLS